MEHEPVDRFAWEQLIRRADLPPTTKLIAFALSTWANREGGNVKPGEVLLADVLDHKPRAIREHLARLRELGLIEVVREATRGNATVYQLTFPGEGYPRIPMRLDPRGNRITPRPVGRTGVRKGSNKADLTGTGAPVIPPMTGTRVPVDNSMTGAPVPVNNAMGGTGAPVIGEMTGTGAHDDRHPGALSPAPGRTDDRRPGASLQYRTNTDHPRPRVSGSQPELTSARGTERSPGQPLASEPPTEAQLATAVYRYARAVLAEADPAERDRALSTAAAQLAATGRNGARAQTIRAAELLGAWNRMASTRPPEQD